MTAQPDVAELVGADLDEPAPPGSDRPAKRERLLWLLRTEGAERLVLTSSTALSWYLEGARSHVSLAAPPVLAVVVDHDGDRVLCTDNEADRLCREELPGDVDVTAVPWHTPLPLPTGPGVLAEDAVPEQLRALRAPLLPLETARLARLGRETATALTEVLSAATPEQTETALAAEVSGRLVALHAEPLVVLVGGASRQDVRHPLPTAAPLGRRALVVVCARRHGLIVNLSRTVVFGPPCDADIEGHRRILGVEAAFLDATRPGRPLAQVFADGCAGYARHGFDPDEWTRHHQGGVAGYAGRDPRATDGVTDRVVLGQAFAWNPTGQGHKVEDTVLLTADGLQPLTCDPAWPTLEHAGRHRPDLLLLR